MNVPKCVKCPRQCFFDTRSNSYSSYCGNTCRLSVSFAPFAQNDYAIRWASGKENPICRVCSNAAFFDSATNGFAPGCTRTHSQQAIRMGFFNPR